MQGNVNSGEFVDVLDVINKTGSNVSVGDKVWINKTATSLDNAYIKTGGSSASCMISPDGSLLYTGYLYNGNNGYQLYNVLDIQNPILIQTWEGVYNSPNVDIAYTDTGNASISLSGNSANRYTMFLKKDGTYNLLRFNNYNGNTYYLGENYWLTVHYSNAKALYTLDESNFTLTQIAYGSYGSQPACICGGYSSSKYILGNYVYTVSGSTINGTYNNYSGLSIAGGYSSRCFKTSSGYKVIGCSSYTNTVGTPSNGQINFEAWNGTTGCSAYDLSTVGLGYWKNKSAWPLYNPNTKILTVASYRGTDYKVYRYNEERNYFDELPILINQEGKKFLSYISFSDDMRKCAYAYLNPSESSITNYWANVKFMVEDVSADTKTVIVPYNFSNNYSTTLTGQAITSGADDTEVKIKTVMPHKVTVNVMADQEDMEIIVR